MPHGIDLAILPHMATMAVHELAIRLHRQECAEQVLQLALQGTSPGPPH
ncbi:MULTISPECIES: hypothetical protein [unclassified Bradyrhizobium]